MEKRGPPAFQPPTLHEGHFGNQKTVRSQPGTAVTLEVPQTTQPDPPD